MHCPCIIQLLFVSVACDSFYKTRQAAQGLEDVGKFGRNMAGTQTGRVDDTVKAATSLVKNSPFVNLLRTPNLEVFSKIMEKPKISASPPRPHVQSAFGKVVKDYFDKIPWRPPSDPAAVTNQVNLKPELRLREMLREKYKLPEVDFKSRMGDEPVRFSESPRNSSDGPFRQPESLKVNSQINNLISQSLFARPPPPPDASKCLKTASMPGTDNIRICEEVNNPSTNSINLKILLNKNFSDILSLSKPDIPGRTSSITIIGNKNGGVNPFQLLTQGDKLDDIPSDKLFEKSDENTYDKSIDEKGSNDYFKTKLPNTFRTSEEDTIKSARRLFDVIQSQNPLDLLNIPLLMNSLKFEPADIGGKVTSTKVCKNNTAPPMIDGDELLQMNSLIGPTTEKTILIKELQRDDDDKYVLNPVPISRNMFELIPSKPMAPTPPRNVSWENNVFPWGALSSVLTQSVSNMPLILIPLNRIRLDSILSGPDKELFDNRYNNSEINKTFTPLAEEMHKIFNYPDVLSKHFSDFDLKDLIGMGSTGRKPEPTKEEQESFLSVPTFKKGDESIFQKRVKDFLKLSRLNDSDIHRKYEATERYDMFSENGYPQMKYFNDISNSSRLSQEAKKSKLHDRAQSILPLLKVAANMAISKYSNLPVIQGKSSSAGKHSMLSSQGNLGNVSHSQVEVTGLPLSWTLAPMIYLSHASFPINGRDSFPVTELNVATSPVPSMFVLSPLNQSEAPPTECSEPSPILTALPVKLCSEVEAKSKINSEPRNLDMPSSAVQNITNSLILGSLQTFEKKLKMESKTPWSENLTLPSSSPEMSRLSSLPAEGDRVNTEENWVAEETGSEVTQLGQGTNAYFSTDNPTVYEANTPIEPNIDNAYANSYWNTFSRNESYLQNDTCASSIKWDNLGNEGNPGVLTESFMMESNATEVTPLEDQDNSTISQAGVNDFKSNMAHVKEILSAMLIDESRDNMKSYKTSQNLEGGNSWKFSSNVLGTNFTSGVTAQSTTPETIVTNSPKKKEGTENWNIEHSMAGDASYYISNKTRQSVEASSLLKGSKSEAFQIPAVLIEILNRMESTVVTNDTAGYNMVLVPGRGNKTDESGSMSEGNNSLASNEDSSQTFDKTNLSQDHTLDPVKIFGTATESQIYPKTDNIFQIVTMRSDIGRYSLKEEIPNSSCPRENEVVYSGLNSGSRNNQQSLPSAEEGYPQESISPIHNTRPIILLAIDPLKSWEYQNSTENKIIRQNIPLGIIIKSTSIIGTPEDSVAGAATPVALVSEAPTAASVEQCSLALKCITTCPPEPCKVREVTVFPIYPMYPVFPLKPIISSNHTAKRLN